MHIGNQDTSSKESEQGRMRRRQMELQRIVELVSTLPDGRLSEMASALERNFGLNQNQNQMENTSSGPQAKSESEEPHGTITLSNVEDVMKYQPWDREQQASGDIVREAITMAAKAILREVPRSPRRTLAIQHLVSARMDANAAISFRGRF